MKKLVFASLFFVAGLAHADLFDLSKSKEYTIWLSSSSGTNFTGTTSYILIDLSDTSSWPHKERGGIHITDVKVQIDKAAASTTTVRMGVVNFLNVSTGSVTWFYGVKSENNVSNTNTVISSPFPDAGINTRVKPSSTANTDGLTPYLLSTEKTSGSTAYQSDVVMPTILSTFVRPTIGDIIIEIAKTTAVDIRYYILIKYYSMN